MRNENSSGVETLSTPLAVPPPALERLSAPPEEGWATSRPDAAPVSRTGWTVPASLKAVWKGWLFIARKIGYVQTLIVTTIVYFIALGPFALVVRFFKDPLVLEGNPSWRDLPEAASPEGLDGARQQF